MDSLGPEEDWLNWIIELRPQNFNDKTAYVILLIIFI
jgi:hypothetical protein